MEGIRIMIIGKKKKRGGIRENYCAKSTKNDTAKGIKEKKGGDSGELWCDKYQK